MDLSICVVSFNTAALLSRTLHAARADAGGLDTELIVVDNASSDGSPDLVRQRFPEARLIANRENRSFSAACNQALAAGAGRFALLLNSDAEIIPGTLGPLIAYLDAHPDVGAATVRMQFPDGRLQHTAGRFLTFRYLLFEHTFLGILAPGRRRRLREWREIADWDRTSERPVEVAPGSFLMVRRTAIEAVGLLDERLRLYFSDDDWCWRLRQAGYPLIYRPSGCVVHPEGASARQVPRLARRLYFQDMASYAAKHFGEPRARWLSALTFPTRLALALSAVLRGD